MHTAASTCILSTPPREAAARVLQRWLRQRLACVFANRLLLLLHLIQQQQEREGSAQRQAGFSAHHSGHTKQQQQQRVVAAKAPRQHSSRNVDDDAAALPSVFASGAAAAALTALLAAVQSYEAAKYTENYTRALLLEEFMASNAVVREASAETRRRLRQRHHALRHLSLCKDMAAAALEGLSSNFCELRAEGGSGVAAAAADGEAEAAPLQLPGASSVCSILQDMEDYLSPPLFAWWRAAMESPKPAASIAASLHDRHVDATSEAAPKAIDTHKDDNDDNDGAAVLPQSLSSAPAPLAATATRRAVDSTQSVDALLCDESDGNDKAVDDDDDDAAAQAYAARQSVERHSFYEATRDATMAGCPQPARNDVAAGGDAASTAEVLFSAAQLAKVSLVRQPVLGDRERDGWRHTTNASALPSSSPSASPLLYAAADVGNSQSHQVMSCAVCELDGVLCTLGGRNSFSAGMCSGGDSKDDDGGDELVRCAACGSVVHTYCAINETASASPLLFCCTHCCASHAN